MAKMRETQAEESGKDNSVQTKLKQKVKTMMLEAKEKVDADEQDGGEDAESKPFTGLVDNSPSDDKKEERTNINSSMNEPDSLKLTTQNT